MVLEDQIQIAGVFFQFIHKRWKDKDCILNGWPSSLCSLDDNDRWLLNKELSLEEVDVLVNQTGGNISPGNVCISYSFIKAYWCIIKKKIFGMQLITFSSLER